MPFSELLLLAFALAMDAFAVALAAGMGQQEISTRQTLRMAWYFGLFQAFMPALGWTISLLVQEVLLRFASWLAALALAGIGLHMIKESFAKDTENICTDPTYRKQLIILALATSIDAFAAGVSLGLLQSPIWTPSLTIGLVALVCTAFGVQLGRCIGCHASLGQRAELAGGILLVALGIKTFYAG